MDMMLDVVQPLLFLALLLVALYGAVYSWSVVHIYQTVKLAPPPSLTFFIWMGLVLSVFFLASALLFYLFP